MFSKNRVLTVAIVATLTLQIGCGAIQQPSWNKPFGKGTWIPAAVCALVGGGTGVGIQEATRGCNTIEGSNFKDCDDREYWQGAVIGAAVGAVLCGVAGHVFLDPPPFVPTPPPPPPPATPAPTPVIIEEPIVPPVVIRRIVLRGINFAFDSSIINDSAKPVLDEAVRQLRTNPDVTVTVIGHTDAKGSEDYNRQLSIRRAESVYRYLVNRGVKPERLNVEGKGESSPVAENDSEDGRARNRRVELNVKD